MVRWLGLVAILMAMGGCATTAQDERREAFAHRERARQAAAVGDYETAQRERREALKAERQAVDKSIDQMNTGEPLPPPLPPPVVPPVEPYPAPMP